MVWKLFLLKEEIISYDVCKTYFFEEDIIKEVIKNVICSGLCDELLWNELFRIWLFLGKLVK